MQYVDRDVYHQMVDNLGIEEAYKQRSRCTGRTVRDILHLTLKLSEGKTVEIHTSALPGNTKYHAMDVLRRVIDLASGLGMAVRRIGDRIEYTPSGGSILVVSDRTCRRRERIPHEMEIYTLHGA